MKTTTNKGIKLLYALLLISSFLLSQNASNTLQTLSDKTLSIVLVDKDSKEVIPFANIVVWDLSATQLTVSTTNMDGMSKFILPSMDEYIVKAVYVGYNAVIDTLFCSKPRCIRVDTLYMESLSIDCYQISCCCCWRAFDVETEEEYYEAERLIERMEEEAEIRSDLNDFVCYPNPTEKYLNVRIDGLDATEFVMMNVKGELMIRKEITLDDYQFEFNLENYASGIYYVVCRGEGLSSNTRTIIKQ